MEAEAPPPDASVARSFTSDARVHTPIPLTLPIPGSPSSSLALYKARLSAAFAGASPRVCCAFWLFGVINNVLYVIILSAALDLVGPSLPKAIVLLADIVPSFATKLLAPYFIHRMPYRIRVPILVSLSFVGMQIIAWQENLAVRLMGVVLASVSCGLGELSFLGMTHFYGPFAVVFWSSGTGAAGLLGAGMYVCATSWIGLTPPSSLFAFAFLPVIMHLTFFAMLPQAPLNAPDKGYETLPTDEDAIVDSSLLPTLPTHSSLAEKLQRTRKLFFPYMLPLLLVFVAEYTINLGVAPTLLFPLSSMPFTHYRDAYPMYNTIYQLGVFISRSSTPFLRIHRLYPPTLLQVLNLALMVAQSMVPYLPSIWLVFVVIFWEGLLGGAVYVNTFAEISERMHGEEREFSLGATTVSDSAGICVAGFVSLWLEGTLCRWQVARGREWCQML